MYFFDALNIDAMKKSRRGENRKVSDLEFSNYLQIQKHCCEKYGTILNQIDRFFLLIKLCSVCGFKNDEIPLKGKYW